MRKKYLFLVFITAVCNAATYTEWGTGVMNNTQNTYSDVKWGEIGYRHDSTLRSYSVGGGLWIDSSQYPGSSSSPYINCLIGIGPRLDHLFLTYFIGPSYVLTPDTILGSNLQIDHELIVGIKDIRDVRLFIVMKHISNAGVVPPNKGRNFLGVGVQF